MIEAALIVARLMQYGGAAVLFGSSLFLLYGLPVGDAPTAWRRLLLATAAGVIALGAALGLGAQASLLAGSWADGLTASAIGDVVRYLDLGKAAVVRGGAALLALVLLVALPPGRGVWLTAAGLGAIITVSLAWMGHAAASEGRELHLVSDVLHVLAAAGWLGALAVLASLVTGAPGSRESLHRALIRFSGWGSVLVAVLLLSGLVNAWFLVGPHHVRDLLDTPYGRLLALKLVLFLAMLALAALNRWRLTPALPAGSAGAVGALKRSLLAESVTGCAVLALVAALGTLVPPVSA